MDAKQEAEDLIDHFIVAINTMVMPLLPLLQLLYELCDFLLCRDLFADRRSHCGQASQIFEIPGLGYKKGQDSAVTMTSNEDDGPALLDTCQVMCAHVFMWPSVLSQPCIRPMCRRGRSFIQALVCLLPFAGPSRGMHQLGALGEPMHQPKDDFAERDTCLPIVSHADTAS